MDLKSHFSSYREALQREAFEGCIEFARHSPTASPLQYPTVYDYLNYARGCAAAAVEVGNADAYQSWLKGHQQAMVALLERMVDAEMETRGGYESSRVFEMIQQKGWNWFKFASKSLTMKLSVRADFQPDLLWIPRYGARFVKVWQEEKTRACFDADEMKIIFEGKPGPDVVHAVIRHKLQNPNLKYLSIKAGNEVRYKPITKVNEGGVVVDWTLPLFPEAPAP